MKMLRSFAVIVIGLLAAAGESRSTLYDPSELMRYFLPFEGKWVTKGQPGSDEERFAFTTDSGFRQLYNVFSIQLNIRDGLSDFYLTVTIYESD